MFLYVLVAFSEDKKTESKFNKVVKEEAKHYANVKEKTQYVICSRGGSRAAATSKMERFVIIVNGF